MSNPQRPQEPHAGWTGYNYSELVDHLLDCRLYMDHLEGLIDKQVEKLKGRRQALDELEAENRKLRDRLTEAERLLRCDDIFVSAGQQEAWKAERDAFLNQKED